MIYRLSESNGGLLKTLTKYISRKLISVHNPLKHFFVSSTTFIVSRKLSILFSIEVCCSDGLVIIKTNTNDNFP